jgi:hypothetical protein
MALNWFEMAKDGPCSQDAGHDVDLLLQRGNRTVGIRMFDQNADATRFIDRKR